MALRELARFVLVSRDAARLGLFYVEAFGAMSSHGADGVELALGPARITLEHRPDALPYPAGVAGWNPLFQHFAIVVDDMAAAYARLRQVEGWAPISTDGPVRLPESSGGVSAFKFRDPDGHPLEFLAFPAGKTPPHWADARAAGPCLGLDHSAISVTDTARSLAFYDKLGLTVSASSLNVGPEQARLDAVADPTVEVTGLAPAVATPHLELLCYRGAFDRSAGGPPLGSVAATRLVFVAEGAADREALAADATPVETSRDGLVLRDPDGHLIEIASG